MTGLPFQSEPAAPCPKCGGSGIIAGADGEGWVRCPCAGAPQPPAAVPPPTEADLSLDLAHSYQWAADKYGPRSAPASAYRRAAHAEAEAARLRADQLEMADRLHKAVEVIARNALKDKPLLVALVLVKGALAHYREKLKEFGCEPWIPPEVDQAVEAALTGRAHERDER